MALELSRRLEPCSLAILRKALSPEIPEPDRDRVMVEEISYGLCECRCSYVDLDALEYLMKRVLGVPAHEFSVKQIPRDSYGRLIISNNSNLTFGEWVDTL